MAVSGYWIRDYGEWAPGELRKRLVFSKVAKAANFFGSGFGDLAGQKLVS
jgi:hypothetical protein